MPQFRTIDLPDVSLRVAMEGQGPLVVLVHGFPESWYSWRHQMGPIAQAGFTACAIDVRGYGGSGKPAEVSAYDMEHLVGDVAALVEHIPAVDDGSNVELAVQLMIEAIAARAAAVRVRGGGNPVDAPAGDG